MNRFYKYGIGEFFISVNEKANIIKAYLNDAEGGYDIKYLDEKEPLGTVGVLYDFSSHKGNPFFVINCDALIDCNFYEILEYHNKGRFDMTIVASLKKYDVPYGVCITDDDGSLLSIDEKPSFNLIVSTGMYILQPNILKLIPEKVSFDMTDLISLARDSGKKIGVYPISENSWHDIGEWKEYDKTIHYLGEKYESAKQS